MLLKKTSKITSNIQTDKILRKTSQEVVTSKNKNFKSKVFEKLMLIQFAENLNNEAVNYYHFFSLKQQKYSSN